MSQENVDAVRAVYDEWVKGNFRAGLDLFDSLVLFVSHPNMPEAGHYLGIDGIEEYMRRYLDAWTNLAFAAEELIEAGDSVVVAAHQSAVGRESGTPVEVRYFNVWTFRGHAVIRLEVFQQRADALEAVGLSE